MNSQRTTAHVGTERTRRKLQGLADRIPPLPEVVMRTLGLLDQPDAEAAAIEAVIQHDPVLVGKLLMLVNSPLFAMNREISTIREGVVLLGLAPLRGMLLAYSAGQMMIADYSCYGHSSRGLWSHSVAVAAGARCLGGIMQLDRESREQLFVAGLLHDIGKMLLAPELNQRRVSSAHFPGSVTAMEKQFLGIDHTEAGALVAAQWNLIETYQETTRMHHGGVPGPADYRAHCAALRVADACAHELGIGFLPGQAGDSIYTAADLQLLGLEGEAWDRARHELRADVDLAVGAMSVVVD
jgi:putative nucleotidyltransferase with HDIG domain